MTRGLLLLLLALPLRAQQLIIHNVSVIDGTEVRRALDVVIEGERIARIGACRAHGHAKVIDASDLFLTAGFADMHEQLFLQRCDGDGVEVRYDHRAIERMLRSLVSDAASARGAIAPGAPADLILLTRNPLSGDLDGDAIDLVIVRGRTFAPRALLGR